MVKYTIRLLDERSKPHTGLFNRISHDIYIYSILRILTIVFSDTSKVKYLPLFHGSYSTI